MFNIRLTNQFQNSYNQQHADGLLSERDVWGGEYDPHKTASFGTQAEAQSMADSLTFPESPVLEVITGE